MAKQQLAILVRVGMIGSSMFEIARPYRGALSKVVVVNCGSCTLLRMFNDHKLQPSVVFVKTTLARQGGPATTSPSPLHASCKTLQVHAICD